jgi:hypothetical protein
MECGLTRGLVVQIVIGSYFIGHVACPIHFEASILYIGHNRYYLASSRKSVVPI